MWRPLGPCSCVFARCCGSARLVCGEPSRPLAETGVLLLGVVEPSAVGILADNAHGDRHIRMSVAAQLGALAVVDALALGLEPHLVQAAWNRIDLEAERRHGPGVNDV